MEKNINTLFNSNQKQEFINSVKTSAKKRDGILSLGMNLHDAFKYGYLDVSRAPLRGIGSMVGNSTDVREKCIDSIIVPFCKEHLFDVKSEEDFDKNHEQLCVKIKEHYSEKGYSAFTVGKAQKWINMALKYACIYDEENAAELKNIFPYCHVPIDRYIAGPIAELDVLLPEYDGFIMKKPNRQFDAEKSNYSWSKIDNYESYLTCQKNIRDAIRNKEPYITALQWEYNNWLKSKANKTSPKK